jgi:hypothetical protein
MRRKVNGKKRNPRTEKEFDTMEMQFDENPLGAANTFEDEARESPRRSLGAGTSLDSDDDWQAGTSRDALNSGSGMANGAHANGSAGSDGLPRLSEEDQWQRLHVMMAALNPPT